MDYSWIATRGIEKEKVLRTLGLVDTGERTDFTVEVYGEPYRATRHDGPLYDPTGARLRA